MDIVFAFSDVGSADLFPFERNLLTILVFFYLGIGFIQQTTNMHTVGAVHERPAVHDRFFGFAWAHSPDAAPAAGRFVNRPYGHTGVKPILIFFFIGIGIIQQYRQNQHLHRKICFVGADAFIGPKP